MAKHVGLFGGSFDPIHIGHLIIARAVAEKLELDQVVFLPSRQPPHKQTGSLADTDHRIAMVRLAIEGEALFTMSNADVSRPTPTYTIETIAHMRGELPLDTELYWIIGADSLAELGTWYRAAELVDSCHIVTAVRPGTAPVDPASRQFTSVFTEEQMGKLQRGVLATPMIDISSTDIRARCRAGTSIRHFVPESVRKYLNQHDLYR